jgi:hypothetical protein
MNRKNFKNLRIKSARYALKRKLIDRLGGKCIDCGYSAHLSALDFDHVDPSKKSFGIGTGWNSRTESQLTHEADKCVVRCANCHRIKTHPNATD